MAGHAPYLGALFTQAKANADFRRVMSTTAHTQLVLMTLQPGQDIGSEVHDGVDQVLLNLEGSGRTVLDGIEYPFISGDVVVVPEGVEHNIVNTGTTPMRLATVYGPPDHRPGTVHHDRDEAEHDEDDVPPQQTNGQR
jgi:mannose-6-phosphate isomerase-like protein (cupin superfamily)